MESSTSSEEVPSLQSASVKTSGMLAVMNMARDVNNFLHSGSEGFVMLDETMSTGVSYDNDGFDVTAERPDLEDVSKRPHPVTCTHTKPTKWASARTPLHYITACTSLYLYRSTKPSLTSNQSCSLVPRSS